MSAKLLIIDDEPLTVDMLSTFLEMSGYICAKAYNGTDGLTLLQVEKPDILIVDLMMPDIEGFEVCQRVRAQVEYATVPIMIISARTDRESIDRAMAAGANAYLTKPPDLKLMLNEIKRLMDGVG
jgi:DNA-binding response OmpR family regulator